MVKELIWYDWGWKGGGVAVDPPRLTRGTGWGGVRETTRRRAEALRALLTLGPAAEPLDPNRETARLSLGLGRRGSFSVPPAEGCVTA